MNCFNHPNTPAVTFCSKCQKSLCHQCSNYSHPALCDECNTELKDKALRAIYIELLLYPIAGFLLCYFAYTKIFKENPQFWIYIILFYGGASVVAGWQYITEFSQNRQANSNKIIIREENPIITLLGKLVKLVLASQIGFFLLPFRLFKLRKRYLALKEN